MSITQLDKHDGITTLTLTRGKVHALNEETADHLNARFDELRNDAETKAVVFTGEGNFFSFGFDVPELYDYTPDDMTRFVTKITSVFLKIFEFPKPVVAAINGHVVAGGVMLIAACDRRVMASGKARVSLNEITFGASLFAGSLEMLRCVIGHRNAEIIALGGAMYSAEEGRDLGLIDVVTEPYSVLPEAQAMAVDMCKIDLTAFADIKRQLRAPVVERIKRDEADQIKRFIDIWYSDSTREQTKGIEIR